MTLFRPCIDIHDNKVKQIVGSTLRADPSHGSTTTSITTTDTCHNSTEPTTNFISPHSPGYFAALYRSHSLTGSHVIMLGSGNTAAAQEACSRWPFHLQVGGGIEPETAKWWVSEEAGKAGKVIVTSYIFSDGEDGHRGVKWDRLGEVLEAIGGEREKLVVDLSCVRRRRKGGNQGENKEKDEDEDVAGEDDKNYGWFVATKKWTVVTDFEVNLESLTLLTPYCSEFLIHSVGVEGLQSGIDAALVAALGHWAAQIPLVLDLAGPSAADISVPLEERTRLVREAIKRLASNLDPGRGSGPIAPSAASVPITYAGGARDISDLELVERLSHGRVDLTIGSALDVFGGNGVTLDECVAWNRARGQLPLKEE